MRASANALDAALTCRAAVPAPLSQLLYVSVVRLGRTASFVALLGAVACGKRRDPAPIAPKTDTWSMHGCELHAAVVPDRARVALGEPVYVTFRLTTECAQPMKLLVGGGGRHSRADLEWHGTTVSTPIELIK